MIHESNKGASHTHILSYTYKYAHSFFYSLVIITCKRTPDRPQYPLGKMPRVNASVVMWSLAATVQGPSGQTNRPCHRTGILIPLANFQSIKRPSAEHLPYLDLWLKQFRHSAVGHRGFHRGGSGHFFHTRWTNLYRSKPCQLVLSSCMSTLNSHMCDIPFYLAFFGFHSNAWVFVGMRHCQEQLTWYCCFVEVVCYAVPWQRPGLRQLGNPEAAWRYREWLGALEI